MSHGLEQKAEQNIMESIEKLTVSSFLMLLFESIMIDVSPELKAALQEKDVKEIYTRYIDMVAGLKDIVDDTSKEREAALKQCMQMKQRLLDIYENLKLTFAACGIIDSYFDDYLQRAKEEPLEDFEVAGIHDLFRASMERYMEKAALLDVEEQAASVAFAVLPNCFTDKEFLDYLNFSAQFYYENAPLGEARLHTEMVRRHFAPHRMAQYGQYYHKSSMKIAEIFEQIGAETLDETGKKLISSYTKAFNHLEGISDVIASLYIGVTYITVILSSMMTFEDILSQNSMVYTDLYNKTRELLKTKDYEAVSETLLFAIDKEVEIEIEQLEELSKRKELIYKNVDFENFSENTKTLFSMELFMTNAFHENIENELFNRYVATGDQQLTPPEKEKERKALALFIKESCFGMNAEQKTHARKCVFLAVPLACSYEPSEVLAYAAHLCEVMRPAVIESAYHAIEKLMDDELLEKLVEYDDESTEY